MLFRSNLPGLGTPLFLEVGESGSWRIYWTASESHFWIDEKDEVVAVGQSPKWERNCSLHCRRRPDKIPAALTRFFDQNVEFWGAHLGNGPFLLLQKASWPPPFAWTRLGGWTCGTRAVWSPDEQWVFLPPPQEGETAFMEDWRGNLWSIVPLEGKLLMRSSREKCVPGKPL